MTEDKDNVPAETRLWLFCISATFGAVIGLIFYYVFYFSIWQSILTGFCYTVIHPIIGFIAVLSAEFLAKEALVTKQWTRQSRAVAVSWWPIVFVFWVVIFIPAGLINHMYRANDSE